MEKSEKEVKLENINKIKKASIWFFVFFVFLIASIGIKYYTTDNVTTIKFVATGENNELSLGNNIRISQITLNKGMETECISDFSKFELSENWELDEANHLITCYNVSKPSEAVIQVRDAKKVSIDFISELGSGFVEVYINDNLTETIDLYSDTDWSVVSKEYSLKYAATSIFKAINIFFTLIYILSFVIAIFYIYNPLKNKLKIFLNDDNRKINIKRAISTGVFAVLSYIVICTVFQNVIYDNIYKENATLTITASSNNNDKALANNVRVIDIYVNNTKYDLSQIEMKNGWEYGMYDSINYMIYSYGATAPSDIDIPLENARTVDIKFVNEVGSGYADISLDGKKIDTVDLYKNCKWEYDTKYYEVSPLIRPHKSFGIFILLFILGFIITVIFDGKNKYSKKVFNTIEFVVFNIILSLILYLIIVFMQKESIISVYNWIAENPKYFIDGFCILIFINLIITMITRKNSLSFGIISLVFVIFLLINYFKLQFRNMPFLPWDFLLAKVVTTVLGQFKLTLPLSIIIGAILLILILALLIWYGKNKNYEKPGKVSRIVVLSCSVCLFGFYMINMLFNVKVDLFDAKNFYMERGFVGAFFENMQYLKPIEEPENYSQETMEDIYDKISENVPEQTEGETPNIIMLMSESFWDITRVKELGFEEEIFPTYRNLQQTSLTGELLANVYGGGTVNSEFEALTGFSVSYLPSEYMPYQRCMRPDFFSINSYLESVGYETLAIHPFEKTNYNRNVAYEYLGFDNSLWEEDFGEDAERMRSYISDKALTEKIISEYEKHEENSDAPWFNMSVSMQNHGGYWDILIDEGKTLDIDVSAFEESSQGSIMDLAIGLHYADLALGELIEYFENIDEPTIIIMFGDHMTNAGDIGETLLDQSALLGEEYNLSAAGKDVMGKTAQGIYEQRKVPFMVWSNSKTVNKKYGVLGIPQLLPTVFSEYDITMPKYFSYLESTQDIYPACASGIVVNTDGSYDYVANMTPEQKAVYDELWLIEYDYLFGENYIGELFEE